jgi:phosphatidylglycerol---prolipoprotein diacylglyceryl transferase
MFTHNINPILLELGPLQIRYYGIIYALAFVFGLWWMLKAVEKKELNITKDDVYNLFFYLIIAIVVGARLFEVLVYHPEFYLSSFKNALAIWNGGLSFHGGLIGAFLVVWWFVKKHNITFYALADILIIPTALGLGFGRIANFINAELIGTITALPWAVKFPNAEGFRHPAQIYAALKNFFVFGTLLFLKKQKTKQPPGTIFWTFVTLYSFIRFFLEYVKEPETIYFGIPLGQIISFILFFTGVYFLYKIKKKQQL